MSKIGPQVFSLTRLSMDRAGSVVSVPIIAHRYRNPDQIVTYYVKGSEEGFRKEGIG